MKLRQSVCMDIVRLRSLLSGSHGRMHFLKAIDGAVGVTASSIPFKRVDHALFSIFYTCLASKVERSFIAMRLKLANSH